MFLRSPYLRIMLTLFYGMTVFAGIYAGNMAAGNCFCTGYLSPTLMGASLRFTALLIVLDQAARLWGVLMRLLDGSEAMGAFFAGTTVALTLIFLQQGIFEAFWTTGRLHRAIDMSCLITEGYGMIFPILMVPLLALATYFHELAYSRLLQRGVSRDQDQ